MSDTGNDKINRLELRIRELEEENNSLNDRVEEIMLLGMITESFEEISDQEELLESVLEKISILKSIPFCTCYELRDNVFVNLSTYSAFASVNFGTNVVELSDAIKDQIVHKSIIKFHYEDHPEYLSLPSWMKAFKPNEVLIFSFTTRIVDCGIFLFMNDVDTEKVFKSDLFLLHQIIRMITDKWDRISLLDELQQMNLALEDRVSERTLELSRTNSRLVHEIKQHEVTDRQLKESEEKFRQLFNMANDAIYLWELNEDNVVIGCIECNKAASAMTGYSAKELKVMTPYHLMSPEYREKGKDQIARLNEHKGYSFKVSHQTKKGSELPVEVSARMFRLNGKRVLLSIVRDRTESLEYEKKLIKARDKAEEADRLKSAFLANMSHEIRTPMNAIIGFGEILKQDDVANDDVRVYSDIIYKNSLHLLHLINDIVDFSKIEANQMNIVMAEFNLNQLMKELQLNAQSLLRNFSKSQIKVLLDIPLDEKSATIHTDGMKLRQVISNLMNNAIKFTNKGTIKLGYRLRNLKTLEFYVSDTGIGIEKEAHEKVFERFTQIKDEKTFNLGGTGLGLAICRNLVEMMGGTIWLESEPDKGTSFYFTHPYMPLKINYTHASAGQKK